MLTLSQMHDYQKAALNHQCLHPNSMLWLDPGLGKTVVTLATIQHLQSIGWLGSVMVIAPLRVCRLVWRQEASKWKELKDMSFSLVMGDRDQRSRALLKKADIYLTNFENLQWLSESLQTYYVAKDKPLPFDGVVFDEVSKMKNSTTHRVKAFKKIYPALKWATGLTGTPAANGYDDLHGQYLCIDGGHRLGTSKTAFQTRFYYKQGFKKVPFHDTESTIKMLISDITLEMSADDYLKMPDLIVNDVEVELPEQYRAMYDQMEKDFFIKLDSGAEVESFNQASLTNRLLQFSNGNMYPTPGMPLWEPIHSAKLEALEDIIEEANGQPILCFYAYRSDAERIMQYFSKLRPINLSDCKSETALNDAMTRWVTGNCQLMICHPASSGHGLDGLQKAGHTIVWYGLNWSLELTLQANARLRRQGQGVPVICHRILCTDTMDQAQAIALDAKADTQTSLRKAIKEYRDKRQKVLA